MPCSTSGHSCIYIFCFQDHIFIILMHLAFGCCYKTGSHLYCLCSQHKCCCDPTAVADTACCDHRNLYPICYLGHQCHGGSLSHMASGLTSFGYHCICPTPLHTFCQCHRGNYRDHADPCFFPHLHIFFRISGTCGNCFYTLFCDHLRNLICIRAHQHYIYPEWFICFLFCQPNLLPHPLCRCIGCSNNTEASCL